MKSNLKKVLAGILALSMVIGGIYYVAPEAKEVQAEATEETEDQITYTTEEYTEDENGTVQGYLNNKTVIESNDNPGWLFAGWFTDEYCTTSVTTAVSGTTYHAKFVDPGVLNVKLQITDGTEDGSSSTNMRLVTSVDSLSYAEVGFEVYYGEEDIENKTVTQKVPIQTVFKRIVASSTSGVDYNYSPKVVDTDSEYFATATLINIANGNFEKPFYIKPYWITNGGATVYGTSRYVTIKGDALSTVTTVNVPVKIAGEEGSTDGNTYTVTEDANASLVYHDGVYAHFRMNKSTATASLTKYNVSNGTNVGMAYYRNLETKYTATDADNKNVEYTPSAADKTWYTAYANSENIVEETEFTIATTADLYSLPDVVNTDGENFSGKTIYIVSDIVANNGTAGTNGWTAATTQGSSWYWSPIGDADTPFKGVFDGCGHAIEGIYTNGAIAACGLFGYTNDARIQNLSLKNSLLKTSSASGCAGSIVARGDAELTNVYSNANVSSDYVQFGGLIGNISDGAKATTSCVINNCWYDGNIYSRNTAASQNLRIGGFVGYVTHGKLVIKHSLFSGDINFIDTAKGGNYVGGFVADSNAVSNVPQIDIIDSLSAGTITLAPDVAYNYVGSVVGRSNGGLVGINNVFATIDCYSKTYGKTASHYLATDAIQIAEKSLIGLGAYHVTNLDFVKSWIARANALPVPRTLENDGYTIAEGATKADTSWYTAEEGKTEYEIADVADLYGIAILVNGGNSFEGITLKLKNNIDLNPEWDASITFDKKGAPHGPTQPVNEWIPIGTSSDMFKGTFDGNGKIISGLYIDKQVSDGNGTGLFGNTCNVDDTNQMCTIKNFALKNSYIYTNATNNVGGIVGTGEAKIFNVYTDIQIYGVNNINLGGIIGGIEAGQKTTYGMLESCWYDGLLVYRSGTNAYPQAGGLVGYISAGPSNSATHEVKNEINHCLFTGTINYKYVGKSNTVDVRIGGLVGRNNGVNSCIKFVDSVSAGNIELYWGGSVYEEGTITRVGSLMGRDSSTNGAALTIGENSVYVTSELRPVYNSSNAVVTTNIVENPDWSTGLQNLDANYWAMTSTIPVLKQLINYTDNWAVLP